jgi:hypothetical protein
VGQFSIDFEECFNKTELIESISSLQSRVDEVKRSDAEAGMRSIAMKLISDYAERSGWDTAKTQKCRDQFSHWVATSITAPCFAHVIDQPTSLLWNCLGKSDLWGVLKDYAGVVVSLPVAETENERIFSIRKYVVGDRGGRTKNDLVTARVRTRMEYRRRLQLNREKE